VKARNWFVRRKIVVVGLLVVVVSAVAVTAAVASFSGAKSENWGVIYRNTIGSPVGELRDGPFVIPTTASGQPPFGKGSLGLEVANDTTTLAAPQDKIAFGNEVDFFGDNFLDLNQVGYRVFQTGEDVDYGGPANLPNITFELDPNLNSTGSNFTSLVWQPGPNAATNVNQWSPYIDATTDGAWYFTGGVGTVTNCNQTTLCSFATIKTKLDDGGASATPVVLSVAIAKGRDNQFQGAGDGLRLNNKAYDFERDGVKERGA